MKKPRAGTLEMQVKDATADFRRQTYNMQIEQMDEKRRALRDQQEKKNSEARDSQIN